MKVPKACVWSCDRKLKTLMHARPLMVGPIINEKVRKFIVLLYKKGGHANCSIAATTAMVLLSRMDGECVNIYKGKTKQSLPTVNFSHKF